MYVALREDLVLELQTFWIFTWWYDADFASTGKMPLSSQPDRRTFRVALSGLGGNGSYDSTNNILYKTHFSHGITALYSQQSMVCGTLNFGGKELRRFRRHF
jgi:hypothetical protein